MCIGCKNANGDRCPRCFPARCNFPEHDPKKCDDCVVQNSLAEKFANQICLLISLDPKDSKSFKREIQSSLGHLEENELQLLTGALQTQGLPSVIHLESIHRRANEFKEPLLSVREPIDDCVALISSMWDDRFVQLPDNVLIVSRARSITFVPDGLLHRQYCIGIRGLDSFAHLFNPPDSIVNAKILLAGETDFFKRFYSENDTFRQLSYLKSIFNDASMNYPDVNHILANWRGLKGTTTSGEAVEIGQKRLLGAEADFLFSEIQSSISTDAKVRRIVGPDVPSKKPVCFRAIITPSECHPLLLKLKNCQVVDYPLDALEDEFEPESL